jgi:hypothetical protein
MNNTKELKISPIFKKFLASHGTRRFTTISKAARLFSLSCAREIQSTSSNPVSLRVI